MRLWFRRGLGAPRTRFSCPVCDETGKLSSDAHRPLRSLVTMRFTFVLLCSTIVARRAEEIMDVCASVDDGEEEDKSDVVVIKLLGSEPFQFEHDPAKEVLDAWRQLNAERSRSTSEVPSPLANRRVLL